MGYGLSIPGEISPEIPPWLGPFLESVRQMVRRELLAAQSREMALFTLLREHEQWMASLHPGDLSPQDWHFVHQQLHQQLNDLLALSNDTGEEEEHQKESETSL